MVFEPMFVVFFLLMSGYIARVLKVLNTNDQILLIDFVFNFALPAMIVERIYHFDFNLNLLFAIHLGIVAALAGSSFAVFLGYIFKFDKITILCIGVLAYFGNIIFIGLPVVRGFFGDEALNEVVLYDQIVSSVPFALIAPFILSLNSNKKPTIKDNIIHILKFPPFIALIFAIVLKNFTVAEFVFEPLRLLSATVVPLALVSVGIGLSFGCIKNAWRSSLVVLSGKMFVAPLIYIAIIYIFDVKITQEWVIAAMLSGMPPMVGASAVIIKAKLNQDLAVASIAMGVIIALFTMPLIFMFLK